MMRLVMTEKTIAWLRCQPEVVQTRIALGFCALLFLAKHGFHA